MLEGEAPPAATHADHMAMRTHNLLSTGSGGLDWAGLPAVAAWLGITDIDGLLQRLEVIKLHRPPDADAAAPTLH